MILILKKFEIVAERSLILCRMHQSKLKRLCMYIRSATSSVDFLPQRVVYICRYFCVTGQATSIVTFLCISAMFADRAYYVTVD